MELTRNVCRLGLLARRRPLVSLLIYPTAIILLLGPCAAADAAMVPARAPRVARRSSQEYGVVIDAGSSGSRVWVYRWTVGPRHNSLPSSIESIPIEDYKVTPGLADHYENKTKLTGVVVGLINKAKAHVPAAHRSRTSMYLLATAGMRLLWENDANEVISHLYEVLKNSSVNPFYVRDEESVRILSGEEEGVFAWIALNYLTGAFVNPEEKTVGILEMGGASTQIAFMPRGNVLANKFPMTIGGKRYNLYVHSYLDFGQDKVATKIMELLEARNPGVSPIPNPCMLRGDTNGNATKTFAGSGNVTQCVTLLEELVYKTEDNNKCQPKPCAIGTVYQPSIPPRKTFYALGAFGRVLEDLGVVGEDGLVLLPEVRRKASEYCSKALEEVEKEFPNRRGYLSKTCMTGLYINVLFVKGYEFNISTRNIYCKDRINNVDIDWTLGALLYEKEHHVLDHGVANEMGLVTLAVIVAVSLFS